MTWIAIQDIQNGFGINSSCIIPIQYHYIIIMFEFGVDIVGSRSPRILIVIMLEFDVKL